MEELAKLDMKDKKILSELDWSARISNTELAKKTGLSKKSVEYRVERLCKLKIIKSFYPLINFNKLGFYIRRIELVLQNSTEKVRKEIEKYLIGDKNMSWALWLKGDCDLAIDIWSRSVEEFRKIFNKFDTKFGQYIKKRRFSTSYGFVHYPYRFILGEDNDKKIIMKEEKNIEEIDKLDKKILIELTKNARQNCSEIARKVGTNYKTVLYRLRQMEKRGILLGTRAYINTELLGYHYYKLLLYFNYYNDKMYKKVRDYFDKKIETTYIVYHVDSDFDVEFVFESDYDFFRFLDKLNEEFPGLIKDKEFWIFLDTIKVDYMPNI